LAFNLLLDAVRRNALLRGEPGGDLREDYESQGTLKAMHSSQKLPFFPSPGQWRCGGFLLRYEYGMTDLTVKKVKIERKKLKAKKKQKKGKLLIMYAEGLYRYTFFVAFQWKNLLKLCISEQL